MDTHDAARAHRPVDLSLKYIGQKTVFVASSLQPDRQAVLDRIENQLTALGYKVLRLMNADAPDSTSRLAFSYTNTALINGVAYVPRYYTDYKQALSGVRTDSENIISKIQKTMDEDGRLPGFSLNISQGVQLDNAAQEAFAELGFDVVPVPATLLILGQGAVHCATMQIPETSTLPLKK